MLNTSTVVNWLGKFIKGRYCNMRLKKWTEESDPWPPVKTKSYVTLALMYQKDLQTREKTVQTIFLRTKGDISDIPTKVKSQRLTDLRQIFTPQSGRIPKTVLIEGHPGIGKTTLVKEICVQWAEGKLLTSDNLVFLLLLRDPNVQKITSMQQLIEHFTQPTSKVTQLQNHLEDNHGADVTLIIDGFDELSSRLRKGSFFMKLIEKAILSDAKVVVTSRPTASACLHGSVDRRIEILGFDHTSRMDYANEALQDSPSKLAKLLAHFQLYPNINAICYIPLLMSIIVFLCMCQPEDLPQTASKMYHNFILHTICHFLKRTGKIGEDEHSNEINDLPESVQLTLQQLQKIAFDALVEDKIVFTIDELPDICRNDPTCYGLLQSVECYCSHKIGSPTKSFNFLHLGIQEYFAAKYVAALPENEVYTLLQASFLVTNITKLTEPLVTINTEPTKPTQLQRTINLSNMWIMYCGITSGRCKSLRKYLQKSNYFPMTLCPFAHSINSYALHQLSFQEISNVLDISPDILKDPLNVLYLFQCFQEAQDDKSCDLLSKSFDSGKIHLGGHMLLPHQVVSLGFFLSRSTRKWKELNLSNCFIGDQGIKLLHHYICGEKPNAKRIAVIDLSTNNLTGISSFLIGEIITYYQPHTLRLNHNSINTSASIFTAIINSSAVKVLFVDGNNLKAQGMSAIIDLICCLEKLYISDNNLDDGTVILSKEIKLTNIFSSSHGSWKILNLFNFHIGDQGMKLLHHYLCEDNTTEQKISTIDLSFNDLTGASSLLICEIVTHCQPYALKLSYNNINACVGDICTAVITANTIRILYVESIGLKALEASTISDVMCCLEELYIRDNSLGDDGAVIVSKGIKQTNTLRVLDIGKNKITVTGAIQIANSLSDNTSLKLLKMTDDTINQSGFTSLSPLNDATLDEILIMIAMKSLCCNTSIKILTNCDSESDEIRLGGYQPTPDEVKHLGSILLHSHRNWKMLNLFKCQIGDENMKVLHHYLCRDSTLKVQEIRVIDLSLNNLTGASSLPICEIITRYQPHTLKMNFNNINTCVGDICTAVITTNTIRILCMESIGLKALEALAISDVMCFLEELYIRDNSLGDNGAAILSKGIEFTNTLKVLDVGKNSITATGAIQIAKRLSNNTSLEVLNMSDDTINQARDTPIVKPSLWTDAATDEILIMIAMKSLCYNTSIKILLNIDNDKIRISGYLLTPIQVEYLVSILLHSRKNWMMLNLFNCRIGDQGIKVLHQYLCGDNMNELKIRTMDLTSNKLTAASSLYICEIITHYQPHTLKLSYNNINTCVGDICTAAITTNTIKILCINGNDLKTQEASVISDVMCCLEELYIRDNSLGDDGAVIISKGIRLTNTLRVLDIGKNKITVTGAAQIANSLSDNTSLEVMNMSDGLWIDSTADEILAMIALKSLCYNTSIKILTNLANDEIRLSGYQLNTNQFKHLGSILSSSYKNWKTLNLSNCLIGDQGIKVLHDYLCGDKENAQKIRTIDLSFNSLTGTPSLFTEIITCCQPHTLKLNYNNINTCVGDICTAVITTNTIRILYMEGIGLKALEASTISDAMCCLEELYIRDNNLGDDGAEMISSGIKQTNSLKVLDIGYNKITVTGSIQIANSLRHNTSIELLDIMGNAVDQDGARAFAKTIADNRSIKELNFAKCKISEAGAKSIANSLAFNASLKVLNMSQNSVGQNGFTTFAKTITRKNKSIKELNFAECGICTAGAIEDILENLRFNNSLEVLNMSQNSIDQGEAFAFAEIITMGMSSLRELNFAKCGISGVGAKTIANSLSHNTSLEVLNMSHNAIDQDGATALAKAICCNRSIKQLNIAECGISKAGTKAIAISLLHNTSLEVLIMSHNTIDQDGATAFADAISTNNTLKKLSLWSDDDTVDEEFVMMIIRSLYHNNSITKLGFPCRLRQSDEMIKEIEKINSARFQLHKEIITVDW